MTTVFSLHYEVKAQSDSLENSGTGQLSNGVKSMMTETRQTDTLSQPFAEQLPEPNTQPFIDLRDHPSPDVLRVLAIGSPPVVEDCVMTLFRLGYARPEEWSQQLPTANPGEVMRILTKRVMLST